MKRFERLLDLQRADPIIGGGVAGGRLSPFSPNPLFFHDCFTFNPFSFHLQLAALFLCKLPAAGWTKAGKPVPITHLEADKNPGVLITSDVRQGLETGIRSDICVKMMKPSDSSKLSETSEPCETCETGRLQILAWN